MSTNDTTTDTTDKSTEAQGNKHSLYYFETVIFKVENTLYRVHKEDFDVKGSVFETMFTLPPGDDECAEGATDARPIVLEGISKTAFQGFLRGIYPLRNKTLWAYEEMIGALHLSTMWGFSALRRDAIDRLTPSVKGNPSYKNIMLAKQMKVQEWLLDAYVTLVLRPGISLEIVELYKQGVDALTITRLFALREGIGARDVAGKHVNCANCTCHNKMSIESTSGEHYKVAMARVKQIFAEEFASLEM